MFYKYVTMYFLPLSEKKLPKESTPENLQRSCSTLAEQKFPFFLNRDCKKSSVGIYIFESCCSQRSSWNYAMLGIIVNNLLPAIIASLLLSLNGQVDLSTYLMKSFTKSLE